MNDREMFEFAAKAAGWFAQNWAWVEGEGFVYQLDGRRVVWNPRDDDGDALRLAVKLEIDVAFYLADVQATQDGSNPVFELYDEHNDRTTATRLAIFRAAVEIGRAMK